MLPLSSLIFKAVPELCPLDSPNRWPEAQNPQGPHSTFSCILGDDGEGGGFVGHSIHQARTVCRDAPAVRVVHIELEWAF